MSGVSLDLPAPVQTLEVCHGTVCGRASAAHSSPNYISFAGPALAFEAYSTSAEWHVQIAAPRAQLVDGDRYSVRVIGTGDTRVRTAISDPVVYRAHYPNGPDCDDGCRVGDAKWTIVKGCAADECVPGDITETSCNTGGAKASTCTWACKLTPPSECGAWKPMAPAPASVVARADHAAVWTGTEMVVMGGAEQSIGIYDPKADSWRVLPSDPRANTYAAIWTGDRIIAMGIKPAELDPHGGWTDLPTPPSGSYVPTLFHLKSTNEIVAWGGSSATSGLAFSLVTRTWRTLPPPPFGSTIATPVASDGTRIVVCDATIDRAAAYDPVTDTWTSLAGRTNVAYASAAGASNGIAILRGETGGIDPIAGGWLPTGATTWTEMGPFDPPLGLAAARVIVTANDVFFLGYSQHAPVDSFASWSIADGSWHVLPPLPARRDRMSAVWTGDRILIWGGSDGEKPHADGWSFTP